MKRRGKTRYMESQSPLFICSNHFISKASGLNYVTCLRGAHLSGKRFEVLQETKKQTYHCNNNLLFLVGAFYFNSSTIKNGGNRTTRPNKKLNLFFHAKGQSLHCFVCGGIGEHCASLCSMDFTQTPVSHLAVITDSTKVSSIGAASLSYCTDQNPSQNTCRIQEKFNYDLSFSTYFLFSTF